MSINISRHIPIATPHVFSKMELLGWFTKEKLTLCMIIQNTQLHRELHVCLDRKFSHIYSLKYLWIQNQEVEMNNIAFGFKHSKKKEKKNCKSLKYIRFPINDFLPNKQLKIKLKIHYTEQ